MAIFHLNTNAISRSSGRSAVAAAAYRSGTELADVRQGAVWDYSRKGGIMSAEIVTPDGVPVPDREQLWNAAEAAEKRKDARTAREWRVALPHELSEQQRYELAMALGKEIANRFGVGADVCIHAPDKEGDDRNFHAHILTTTRKIAHDGSLGEKSNIELENATRKKRGLSTTTQDDIRDMRAYCADLINEHLERAGHDIRVDHRSFEAQGVDLEPSKHVGVSATAMQRKGKDADRAEIDLETRAENARKIIDHPEIILAKITATQAVFERRDIARELSRHIDDKDQFQGVLARLEQSPDLVQLAAEKSDGKRTVPARFSTRAMIEIERSLIGKAQELAEAKTHGVAASRIASVMAKYESLSGEQRAAVEHVTKAGQLAVIIGDAGTGKSFGMRVAAEAWEAQGYRVRGCALAGKAAEELEAGSGIESRTIHSLEASWKNGKNQLTSNDILVIDEAGMVGSRQLSRVLEAAQKAGAKVVMLGDDKQLAAIEAGAGFRGITERVGAAEITQIRRQTEEWAKEASAEFARGDMRKALDAYNDRGHVRISETLDDAKKALAADWLADSHKDGSSIILAYRNRDVIDLNNAVRDARKEAGELQQEAEFLTARGARSFGKGDRIVMLENNRELGVKNGSLGTVEAAENGQLTVKLDNGKTISFGADQYDQIDHGYAVTVHKSQGVTVDRAYLLATSGMGRELAYVGMTRHREQATLYAGADDFAHTGRLVAHGEAPYQHEEGNSRSYFATLENDKGEQRTLWGVDLERAIADAGTRVGDKVSFEHVGAETVQLPDGQSVQRNSWKVSTSTELAYDKLVERLAQQKPNESTLDYMEATANYADRRGFDGFAVVGRIVERGIVKFNELADSIKYAVGRAIGYSEPRVEPQPQQVEEAPKEKAPQTAFWQKSYSDADLFGEPSKPERISEAKQATQPAAERSPVQPVDGQEKALQHYRDKLEAAQRSGDEIEIVMATGKLEKAEQLAAAGEPIPHNQQAIEAAGTAAFNKWIDQAKAGQQEQTEQLTADELAALYGKPSQQAQTEQLTEAERAALYGHQPKDKANEQLTEAEQKALQNIQQKPRRRDRGIDFD
ncbi:Ti-type conjugative transfer relaxase TraA [Salmonella enterica]|nr:Ti-type conjugative transfer relaxase TraA [Salmonella enterica]